MQGKKMKLYELSRGSYFKLDEEPKVPPAHDVVTVDDSVYKFDHIDGMYSYCLDKDKKVVHFAAWTQVQLV
jgi:hypothetical protein